MSNIAQSAVNGIVSMGAGAALFTGFRNIDDGTDPAATLPKVLGMGVGAGIGILGVGVWGHAIATGQYGMRPVSQGAGATALGLGALVVGGAAAAYMGSRLVDGMTAR